MKSLVIGATGLIGNHIVRELLKEGHEVIAASRGVTPAVNLEDVDVPRVKVDVMDVASLTKAFRGVEWVFQAAAYYPGDTFHKAEHVKRALAGTQNIIQAARNASIQRLIYTSSLTTIGRSGRRKLATEEDSYRLAGRDPHPYFLVKHLCEEALRDAVRARGLPVVIVNPSGCFGPYDLKPKNLCLIPQLIQRKIPAFVRCDINVVDAADVARGHILAAKKGVIGERYILGGHNVTMEMVLREICEVAGVKPPRIAIPVALGLGVCYVSETIGYVLGKKPALPVLAIRFAQHGQHLSIDKAVRELGYTVGEMAPCYERAIAWFRRIGYC